MNNKNFKYKLNNSVITNNTFTTALKEATTSSLVNTTIENTMNGGSFKDMLKDQLTTSLVMAGANLATKGIGSNYHEGNINKGTQLFLHGVVGATSSKLLGNDIASGAVSSIMGEVTGELLEENTKLSNDALKEMGGLAGGLSALATGGLQGLDANEISSNVFNGQRLGKNAVENNLLYKMSKDLEGSPFGKHTFLVLDPDNPENFTPEQLKEKGIDVNKIEFIMLDNGKEVITVSGQGTSIKNGNLVVSFNNEFDIKALNEFYNIGTEKDKTKWYKPDYDVESVTIKSNLNDTDFLYNILINAQNYEKNTNNKIIYKDESKGQTILHNDSIDYNLFPKDSKNEGNCNSFSNSILNISSATNQEDYVDMKGIDPGKNSRIDIKYFR